MKVKGWAEGLKLRGHLPTGKAHIIEEWAGFGGELTVGCGARIAFRGPFFATSADAASETCTRCDARVRRTASRADGPKAHAGGVHGRSALA